MRAGSRRRRCDGCPASPGDPVGCARLGFGLLAVTRSLGRKGERAPALQAFGPLRSPHRVPVLFQPLAAAVSVRVNYRGRNHARTSRLSSQWQHRFKHGPEGNKNSELKDFWWWIPQQQIPLFVTILKQQRNLFGHQPPAVKNARLFYSSNQNNSPCPCLTSLPSGAGINSSYFFASSSNLPT